MEVKMTQALNHNKSDKESPILKLLKINKHFGGVNALSEVDFELYKSEIVALIGDNGAGKSTLIKVITGVHQPDGGEIFLEGKQIKLLTPKLARELNIETIFQDLALFNGMDITANLFANREIKKGKVFLNKRRMDKLAMEALNKTGITIGSTLRQKVGELSGGQKHAVAISRAVYVSGSPRIILMDEPTAGLGVMESKELLNVIKNLKKTGVSVILITHNLEHAFEVADRFVILRGGKKIGEKDTGETNRLELVKLMVGG
jgi:ABC-type sugar transport system ATPase subunit